MIEWTKEEIILREKDGLMFHDTLSPWVGSQEVRQSSTFILQVEARRSLLLKLSLQGVAPLLEPIDQLA